MNVKKGAVCEVWVGHKVTSLGPARGPETDGDVCPRGGFQVAPGCPASVASRVFLRRRREKFVCEALTQTLTEANSIEHTVSNCRRRVNGDKFYVKGLTVPRRGEEESEHLTATRNRREHLDSPGMTRD